MLYEFYNNPVVTEFRFTQTKTRQLQILNLAIFHDNKDCRLLIKNPYPLDNCFEIVEADRIWLEKDSEGQLEYGSIKVSFYANESYVKFWCDSVEEL